MIEILLPNDFLRFGNQAAGGIVAGIIAGSIALIGFGADSIIEFGSIAILLWRLNHEFGEQRERTALRLVGVSFLLLAVYVGWEAIESLVKRQPPSVSYFGIIFSALCLVVMPVARPCQAQGCGAPEQPGNGSRLQTKLHLWLPACWRLLSCW